MKLLRIASAFLLITLCMAGLRVTSSADLLDDQYVDVYKKYPRQVYIVGISEVHKTKNAYNDRRVAEVMARIEIAKQIKVRVKEESIDVICEGKSKAIPSGPDCKNSFSSIVEMSVDEFLQGSRIAEIVERNDRLYAVALLARKDALSFLDEKVAEALGNKLEHGNRAKAGDEEAKKKADEEYRKALAYAMERKAIEGVKVDADRMFEELEKELAKVGKR